MGDVPFCIDYIAQNEFNKDNKFAQNMMQDNNIIDIIPSEGKLKVI